MTASCAHIDDGYTREATFPAMEAYPAVKISYRPMLRSERSILFQRVANLKTSAVREETALMLDDAVKDSDRKKAEGRIEKMLIRAEQMSIDAVVSHLVSWDCLNAEGEAREINAKEVRNLDPNLFDLIYNTICRTTRDVPVGTEENAETKN